MNDESLWSICETTYFPRRLSIRSPKTRLDYRYAIADFGRSLGRQATLADLDDDAVTVWIGRMLDCTASVYTVREKAGRVLALWRWLAARRLVDRFPTVRLPAAPEVSPLAWDRGDLARLFEAAAWEPGFIGPVLARHWWMAMLGFAWSTAERYGAIMALRWEWVDLQRGVVVIPAASRKGRLKPATYFLWPEVVAALAKIQTPPRELVFPWDRSESCYYKRWDRILRRAGLPKGRRRKTHSLRVSHATWTAVAGGDATRALMHSDPATTKRHYIDCRLLPPDPNRLFVPWEG